MAGHSGNSPLNLDWHSLLPDYDPSTPPSTSGSSEKPKVGTVAPSPSGRSASRKRMPLSELSDGELYDAIDEAEESAASLKMAGEREREAILRRSLLRFYQERDRRRLATAAVDSDECAATTLWNCKKPLNSVDVFSQTWKSNKHEYVKEKFRLIFRDKHKKLTTGNDRHVAGISSKKDCLTARDTPFRCLPNESRVEFSSLVCEGIETYSIPDLKRRRCDHQQVFNERAAGKVSSSWNSCSEKVKVVLLDDDVQCSDPLSGDASEKWKEVKVYYPERLAPESVELSYSDIKCLDSESFVSSTIISFYIQYLQRSFVSLGRPRGSFYIFNTYFYEKLKKAMSCEGDKHSSLLRLRRWLKGENIFHKSYVFFPIHGNSHWSLVIICNPDKEDECGPIFLHLDSLEFHTSDEIFNNLVSFLTYEWNYMNQNNRPVDPPFNDKIWKNLPGWIEKKKIAVPQQMNCYDCGVFVLYFMEKFLKQAPGRLVMDDHQEHGMFGTKWFKPEEASGLRRRIRELLMEEFENSRLVSGDESPPSVGSTPPKSDAEHHGLIDLD